MNKNFKWKSIDLCKELHISGAFLYDAILLLDKMEHFYYEDECFCFLYNVSVGIERLEKIAIILLEHTDDTDQEEFEKSLITHNHLELIKRIKKISSLNFGTTHTKFLKLMSDFYKSFRYDRYNLSSVFDADKDQSRLVTFVSQELKVNIDANSMIFPTKIDKQIRHFIGKTISKIAVQLYGIIREQPYGTYELRYDSKAFKIFIAQEYHFDDERLCQKEVFIHLMNNQDDNYGFMDFVKQIEPLELDSGVNNEYVNFMFDCTKDSYGVVDAIRQIYKNIGFDKERFEMVPLIGDENVSFDVEDDFCEDDDLPI